MAENCINVLQGLDATCGKRGGVKKRVWIGRLDDIDYTTDGDGYVDTITLATASPANLLYKYIGKKFTHGATYTGVVGSNFNSINQAIALKLYFFSPAQRESIEKLWNAEDVVVFVETEAGQVEVWGLDTGLNGSALGGGNGILLQDDTSITVTLSGDQDGLSKVMKTGTVVQDDVDYLDALTAG